MLRRRFLILLFSFFYITTLQGQSWNVVGTAGFSVDWALWTNLVIADSIPYIVYRDHSVEEKATVMKFHDGAWGNVGIPGFSDGEVNWPSIDLGSSGDLYVAYQDGANNLKATVKKYNGTDWINIGSAGFSSGRAFYFSFVLGPGDVPYVAYYDDITSRIFVEKYNGSAWVVVGTPGFSGGEIAFVFLAIDASGTPYVVFGDVIPGIGQKATVMKFDGSAWIGVGPAAFSTGTINNPRMAFDSIGTPYVSYQDNAFGEKATVMKYDGITWTNVGSAGFSDGKIGNMSMVIHGSVLYTAYTDYAHSEKATVMKFDGVAWTPLGGVGCSAGGAESIWITLDGRGTPYIGYSDGAYGLGATVLKLNTSGTGVVNIDNHVNSRLLLYPNPTEGLIKIKSMYSGGFVQIVITDILGKIVKELNVNFDNEISIQLNLPNGTYYLTAIFPTSIERTKVTIK